MEMPLWQSIFLHFQWPMVDLFALQGVCLRTSDTRYEQQISMMQIDFSTNKTGQTNVFANEWLKSIIVLFSLPSDIHVFIPNVWISSNSFVSNVIVWFGHSVACSNIFMLDFKWKFVRKCAHLKAQPYIYISCLLRLAPFVLISG